MIKEMIMSHRSTLALVTKDYSDFLIVTLAFIILHIKTILEKK